jgi:serine/threonine protein phosphatase PrpC
MGAYLDAPIKDKNPENGEFDIVKWGACSMQGWRCGMEDAHLFQEIDLPGGQKGAIFGVFDGHGGKDVAVFAEKNFKRVLEQELKVKDVSIKKALESAFLKLDAEVEKEDYAVDTGTTSCVVLISPTEIYCANAGDSRAVLCCDDKAIPLSEDHKPDCPGEL